MGDGEQPLCIRGKVLEVWDVLCPDGEKCGHSYALDMVVVNFIHEVLETQFRSEMKSVGEFGEIHCAFRNIIHDQYSSCSPSSHFAPVGD